MTLVENGVLCNCGSRGCWETLVSQTAVLDRVRRAIRAGETTKLTAREDGDIVIGDVLRATPRHDTGCPGGLAGNRALFGNRHCHL